MVTGCKPPHNVPADASACVCVRHLFISRAELCGPNCQLALSYNSLLCRSRPCNIRFAGHATLVTFHNQGTYSGSEQFLTGPTIKRHRSTGKLSRVHFPFMQLRQQQCQHPSIHPISVDNNHLPYHMACSLWVIWRDDQQQVSWNHQPSSQRVG